jgi:hypothetical protein
MSAFLGSFKEQYPQYENTNIIVESFSDATTYEKAFFSAAFQGVAPDIFVLENTDRSPLTTQFQPLDPSIIAPNTFRLAFKTLF